MLNLTLKLPEKVERPLEKDFAYLEKTTKKPREYHFNQALIRYIEELEWELEKRKLKEEKKVHPTPEELEALWNRLRNTPPEHHYKEALVTYIEDMEDIRDVEKYKKKVKEGKAVYYTSEEVEQHLKEYYASKESNKGSKQLK
jgi:predicted DNA-binding protein